MDREKTKEVIASAIGYHFWNPDNYREAISCGMDAAEDVMKALEQEERVESNLSDQHFHEHGEDIGGD